MSESPPRRIGEKRDYPLHSPPQRHHPDPAAAKSMIRPLQNQKIDTTSLRKAAPDAGDTGAPLTVANPTDHADAVAKAMTEHMAGQTSFPAPHVNLPKGA